MTKPNEKKNPFGHFDISKVGRGTLEAYCNWALDRSSEMSAPYPGICNMRREGWVYPPPTAAELEKDLADYLLENRPCLDNVSIVSVSVYLDDIFAARKREAGE